MIDDTELRDLDPFALFDGEAQRLDGYFAQLSGDEWLQPTRCEGWRRRELLAHLAASEEYNHASIDATVPAMIAKATAAGVTGVNEFNQWGVDLRTDRSVDELLAEWRAENATTRRRFRELGWDGSLATFVGPYPVGLQALHLAQELAIHADDLGVPIDDAERQLRATWQPRFARVTVREYERAVTIEPAAGGNTVSSDSIEAVLTDEELVDACSARLPADHPLPQQLRDLLRVFA